MARAHCLKTFLFFSPVFLLLFGGMALAQNACPQVQCDCGVLPLEEWQIACSAREQLIQKRCEQGQVVESLYCTMHGPAANRLPLNLKLEKVDIVATEKLPDLYKRVGALYWSVRKDSQAIAQDSDQNEIERATARLGLLQRNVASLFALQQQITGSWLAKNNTNEALKSWKDFASDTQDMAEDLNQLGRELQDGREKLNAKQRTVADKLAFTLLAESAGVFEQAAYAFAEAEQHDNAARNWLKAADTSAMLINILSPVETHSAKVQELTYQRAAQLYRASYHWVKEEREGEAKDSLKKAQELFDGKDDVFAG